MTDSSSIRRPPGGIPTICPTHAFDYPGFSGCSRCEYVFATLQAWCTITPRRDYARSRANRVGSDFPFVWAIERYRHHARRDIVGNSTLSSGLLFKYFRQEPAGDFVDQAEGTCDRLLDLVREAVKREDGQPGRKF